jgi:hypothetical protein
MARLMLRCAGEAGLLGQHEEGGDEFGRSSSTSALAPSTPAAGGPRLNLHWYRPSVSGGLAIAAVP